MHPSAEVIASWPAPNFKDPVTRGSALTVVNVIFITLVVLVAGLRFYTRLRITKSFGLDDWIIAISLILFFWAATLNKISLLCFYHRLTGPCTPKWYKFSIFGGIIFQITMVLAYFIVALLACRPLKAFWEPLATYHYTCIDEGKLMLSFSIITIFLDFIILLLPIPIVWKLQLSRKQRLAILSLFGAGIIVCIAGIVHAYFVNLALVKSYDETWTGWPLWICSAVEVDLGIVVPAVRPLLAIYFPRLLESTRPRARPIKEWYDSNEISPPASTPGKGSVSAPRKGSVPELRGTEYFAGEKAEGTKDLETGLADKVKVGNTTHDMVYT
ncbi:MAG: hypothetical protein Q9191_005431 [Dirinaria sp. TL-2023a]